MRFARRLVVFVVIVVGLAVGVDRLALVIAQDRAAKKFQTSQHLASRPTVRILGFPFLTQLASRTLSSVRVEATGLVVSGSGRSVRVSSLRAQLHDVQAASDLSSVRAKSATGTAVISYPDLSSALGAAVSYSGLGTSGHGRVKAIKSISLLGQSVSGAVTAEPAVTKRNTVAFSNPQVTVNGANVPPSLTSTLGSLLSQSISLEALPLGLTVQSVAATTQGVVVTLTSGTSAAAN
jgi:hypothetical protein